MTDPAPPPNFRSGAHDHDDLYDRSQVEVEQSQEIRTQLGPLVKELNRIIDRLEYLAGYETHDQEPRPDGTTGPGA